MSTIIDAQRLVSKSIRGLAEGGTQYGPRERERNLLQLSCMCIPSAGAAVALAVWKAMGPYTQHFKFVPYDHSA